MLVPLPHLLIDYLDHEWRQHCWQNGVPTEILPQLMVARIKHMYIGPPGAGALVPFADFFNYRPPAGLLTPQLGKGLALHSHPVQQSHNKCLSKCARKAWAANVL